MGEDPPRAHPDGGGTPARDRTVVSGTWRSPGVQGPSREAPPRARPPARTAVPDGGREAVAPDTVGTNASNVCPVGGRTPAPRRRVVARADRKPGLQGTTREAPPGA